MSHTQAQMFSASSVGREEEQRLRAELQRHSVELTRAARKMDVSRGELENCSPITGGWGAWRDGIFSFHHFHSTAHEVLGIVAGSATVMLGGPGGRRFEVRQGDVLVLPAGTGHCNQGAGADLLVIGAYADGMEWDIRRGDPAEHDEALRNIRAVPLPRADPVHGVDGPLTELWRDAGGAA
jgi:uncharacterized protein YjlB